jgi:hypothetical protein
MSMMGDPNYDAVRQVSADEILSLSDYELLYSYLVIEVEKFEFPNGTKYPSIACYADETTTGYPLCGKAMLTGSEYIVARNQGCELEILGGTLIPFVYENKSIRE